MKQTINLNKFQNAFDAIRPENFTYEGLEILFDYIEDCERDSGEELELDVIALCCDFAEDFEESVREYYSLEPEEDIESFEGYIGKTSEDTIIYRII